MSKVARISTTITARYTPSGGATDAFWLDSRMPGSREVRAADITLDREDRGFFFSVFAAPSISKDSAYDLEAVKPVLDRMHMDVKYSAKNIDNLIVDFAECGTGVVGKKTIAMDGVKHPFFSGIIVKSAEVAAVTTGRGCAYLYRNDTLYPLTHDDLGFEAIDYNGKSVPNIEIYCAGSVGNVRYSNIAQLQVDDCIIVCNKDIMTAVGQHEMLRILNESYDQSDAAGMVITAAAAKLPGATIQFMIGFVESITDIGKHVKGAAFLAPALKTQSRVYPSYSNQNNTIVGDVDEEGYVIEADDNNEDEYDDDEGPTVTKKIALLAIILIVTVACGFAIWWAFLRGEGVPSLSSESSSVIVSVSTDNSLTQSADSSISIPETSVNSTTPESTTTSSTSTPTSAPVGTIITKHTIVKGELLSEIATKYYKNSSAKYMNAIVQANKAKFPNISVSYYQEGWVLDIPKVD